MRYHFRYLVDSKWYKQWQSYVGFDSWDTNLVGDKSAYPGPIDNKPLFKGNPFVSWLKHLFSYTILIVIIGVSHWFLKH